MSTYPVEFKALEEENKRLEAENKELKESISQCHQAYHKTSIYHRNRIKELEAGLRSILYESKSKAYSPEIVQNYAEQALEK